MLGDLFYSIQRYAQTGEQYYIIDDCELKIDDADALGEEDAGGVGNVMMGNIIPVMVLRPLRIMLLLMEGMGSGGEGLDVEGGDGDGGAAELVEADEDAGCGGRGVYGVVGGSDVVGVGDVVEDVVGDVVVGVVSAGVVRISAWRPRREGPRMTVMCWPGVRGGG